VYGIGHALVDLQFAVDEAQLSALGVDKGVMTLVDGDRRRAVLDGLGVEPVNRASGGSAANTVITVARFGGRAYYAFQVGDDDWGNFYRYDLSAAGVDNSPASQVEGDTGQCLVMVTPDADRTMNTFLGASGSMGSHQVDADTIGTSRFVYLEGYLLTTDVGMEACEATAAAARDQGVSVSLTLSDPSVVQAFRDRFDRLIDSGIDLLFCNEDEAKALSGSDDRDTAVSTVAGRAASVCVTLGADGALVASPEAQSASVSGHATAAVDTTGAGDTFAGGVLFGLTHGHDLEASARLGSYAAAVVVSVFGPRLGVDLASLTDDILGDRAPAPVTLVAD
jgi:fructokinase